MGSRGDPASKRLKSRPSGLPGSSSNEQGTEDAEYIQHRHLYRAVDNGNWEATKKLLEEQPNALTASLSEDGDTALHIAVLAGHVEIVEQLVGLLTAEDLAIKNKKYATALNYAAIGGVKRIAEDLVKKNRDLLIIRNWKQHIPVVVAALHGHKDLVRYLYSESPVEELSPERGKNGAMLLTNCILDDLFDIALDLLQHYPQLAFEEDSDGDTALDMLARKPFAFPSGSTLALWQRWIYSCIRVPEPYVFNNSHGDVEKSQNRQPDSRNIVKRALDRLLVTVWWSLKPFVPAIKHMYNLKLMHGQAHELLSCICEQLSCFAKSDLERIGVYRAVFDAVKHGIVEFIVETIRHYPEIIWCEDKSERGIFAYATLQRQEKIFSLIYRMGAKMNSMASAWDKNHNNILHQAAYLAPSSRLDLVSGAALQMQRELQWFKEVESIVQPKYKDMLNKQHKTPGTLFTESHRKLMEEGEEWMKNTAESCTVVAALIVTIMFAALFTAPGGYNNDNGMPVFLNRNSFLVFIVSDAMSLFASTSSLLMFLGILKARYREEDFLKSLPNKLIIGLSTLFFSIASMMGTFGVALVLMLEKRISWVFFPTVVLASLPVTLFAVLQFHVLLEIFISTYGPGIFYKPNKEWLFGPSE